MSTPESADEPYFDIIAFEAAAKARAVAFVGQVTRLAILPVEGTSTEWLSVAGAHYMLPDGLQIDAQHETWDNDSDKVIAKVKITRPMVQSIGIDSNLRQVRLMRFIQYGSFLDEPSEDYMTSLRNTLPPAPKVAALEEAFFEKIDQAGLEDRLDPTYRPSELVWARSAALVQCRLPHSQNFRTETDRPATMSAITRMAHIAARRQAGEPVNDPAYDIAEHSATIALLGSIDTTVLQPLPLDADFAETWLDPMPGARSWRPTDQ